MATRKYIGIKEAVEIVCNDESGNELESNDSESHIIICGNARISGNVLHYVSPNYHLTPHDFTPAAGPNSHTERTNVINSMVNSFIVMGC